MGGAVSRIFSPGAAKVMISNTNSTQLKSALQNYIKAVNSLNNNARTENKLIAMMNDTGNGLTNSYKKRIANSIASIVAKVPRVAAKAANAAAGATPVTPAVVAVNNLTSRIKNLNNFMGGFKGGNSNSLAQYYKNSKRNYTVNSALNAKHNGGARYSNLWNKLNQLALPMPVASPLGPPLPAPAGIAGKLFGVTKGENQNNNASRTNINYIAKIAKNKTYKTNENRVQAALAYNPTLKFAALVNKTNNANVKRLLKLLANVPAASRPAATAAAVNAVTNTGEALSSLFANRTALTAVLAKTTNQKLQSNINNRNKSAALMKELKNTAAEAGVNLKNKNVNAALTRIMTHETRLPAKAGTTVPNRSRLNAALAKSMNQQLKANITNRSQVNALMKEVRNAAQAAGVNLKNKNVNAALTRIMTHESSLPAKVNNSAAKAARATAAALALWKYAGTGRNSNTNEAIKKAINTAKGNSEVSRKNVTRANIEAILKAKSFAPPSNNSGSNRERHLRRVSAILNGIK